MTTEIVHQLRGSQTSEQRWREMAPRYEEGNIEQLYGERIKWLGQLRTVLQSSVELPSSLITMIQDYLVRENIVEPEAVLDREALASAVFLAQWHWKQQLERVRADSRFFRKKSFKTETPEAAQVATILHAPDFTHSNQVLVQLREQSKESPKASSLALQVATMVELLSQRPFSRPELTSQMSAFQTTVFGVTITLEQIVGPPAFSHLTTKLAQLGTSGTRPLSVEVEEFCADAQRYLTSARTLATLSLIALVEGGEIPRKGDFLTQLRAFSESALFEEVDVVLQLHRDLQKINAEFPGKGEQHTATASYLHMMVERGWLDSTYARELWHDLSNDSPDIILTRFWSSFTDSLSGESRGVGRRKRKKVSKVGLAVLVAALFAGGYVASGATPQETVTGVKDALRAALSLASEVRDSLNLPKLFSKPTTIGGAEQDPLVVPVGRAQAFLEEIGVMQAAKSLIPISVDQLTHPSADFMEGGFKPTAVSYEQYAQTAEVVNWELHNWEHQPGFLLTTSYYSVDLNTSTFHRDYPLQEESGKILAPLAFENWYEQPNVIVGAREVANLSWADLPHEVGMEPTAASVWVFVDGIYARSLPVEWWASDTTMDQSSRAKLSPEDFAWLDEQRGKTIGYKVAYSFGPASSDQMTVEVGEVDPNAFIAFTLLPTDLQLLIQQLNANQTMSDQEKLLAYQAWFTNFGIYTFNPADDQWGALGYLNTDHSLPSFTQLFFMGYNDPRIGGGEYPRPGAGECNRRNTAAWSAIHHLNLQGNWVLSLDTGFQTGGSNYSNNEEVVVRGNQRHMMLVATNRDTQERLILDVTLTPETDQQTSEVLEARREVEGLPDRAGEILSNQPLLEYASQPVSLMDMDYWHYYPAPEVSQYPTVFEPKPIAPADVQLHHRIIYGQAWPDSFKYDLNSSDLPWQFLTFEFTATSQSNLHLLKQIFPVTLNERGEVILVNEWEGDPTEFLDPSETRASKDVTYKLKLDGSTNLIPVVAFSHKIFTSHTFVTVNGQLVPIRYVASKSFDSARSSYYLIPAIVIDLPPEMLADQIVEVSLNLESFPPDHQNDIEKIIIRPWSEVQPEFAEMGISEADGVRLYLDYALRYAEPEFHQVHMYPPSGRPEPEINYKGRHPFTQVVESLRELDPEKYADLIFYLESARDLTLHEDLSELEALAAAVDRHNPQLVREWIGNTTESRTFTVSSLVDKAPGRYVYDQNLGVPLDILLLQLETHLQRGTEIEVAKLAIGPGLTDGSWIRQMWAREFLVSYLIEYYVPVHFPYEDLTQRTIAESTVNTAVWEFCSQTSQDQADLVHCLNQAPYSNKVQSSYLTSIYMGVISGQTPPPPMGLELQGNEDTDELGLGLQVGELFRIGRANFDSDHIFPYLIEELKQSNPSPYYQTEATVRQSPDEKNDQVRKEARATQKWYFSYLAQELGKGNPAVVGRFLPLFLPLAGLSLLGLSAVGSRKDRRWAINRDVLDKVQGRQREVETRLSLFAQMHGLDAEELSVLLSGEDLDSVWREPLSWNQTEVLRRKLVTQLGWRGETKFPLKNLSSSAVENPWNSRNIPPTYLVHIRVPEAQYEAWVEALTGVVTDELRDELGQILKRGISDGSNPSDFTDNELVLLDLEAWKKELKHRIRQQLQAKGSLVVDEDALDHVVHDYSARWQVIMMDAREFEQADRVGVKRAQRVINHVRSRLLGAATTSLSATSH